MYNTDIHTQKPCCHTGMQITNVSSHAKHIQSTQKTHGNCRRKSCGKELQKSRHMQSTCNHMVITGGSHVNAKYEFLVTSGHMVITGGIQPRGSKLQISRLTNSTCKAHEKPCDHTVITHESHVCTRGHVDNMCNNVVLDPRSPHESTRTPYNFVRRFLIG